MKFKYILFAIYTLIIVLLLASVIHGGYSYLFDPDELFHINVVYLLKQGLLPYENFWVTYTPVFHLFLSPVSFITGFTFSFLQISRIFTIGLFIIRLILIFFITKKLFGIRTAYVFIPLSLFDPFTAFTGMQVRPDNLMMTLYLAGLLFIIRWLDIKKVSLLIFAGLLLGTSILTLIKNIPATVIVTLFICSELVKTRNFRAIFNFILAMMLPVLCFILWSWSQGVISPMIQQIVFDAKTLNDSLRYPQNILNYYWPPNFVLYGFPGRPITWAFELCLPLIAFAGMYTVFLHKKEFGVKHRFIAWFTVSCILQWISLLFVRSVFLQYFLPVSWFLAVFAAYALTHFYESAVTNRFYKNSILALSAILLIVGFIISWKANSTRSRSSYDAQKSYFTLLWHTIPTTATVFPGTLFRQNVYPLGFQTNFVDLTADLLKRYGSPSVYLDRYTIPFIIIDTYNFSFLDTQTQEYVKTHYKQNQQDLTMWIRRP